MVKYLWDNQLRGENLNVRLMYSTFRLFFRQKYRRWELSLKLFRTQAWSLAAFPWTFLFKLIG